MFEKKEKLEADGGPLTFQGKEEIRDIVEFVPFEQYRGNPQALAERTLQKLPFDVTSYMALHNIQPNPPQAAQPYYVRLSLCPINNQTD